MWLRVLLGQMLLARRPEQMSLPGLVGQISMRVLLGQMSL
jgi:hypothetical protein